MYLLEGPAWTMAHIMTVKGASISIDPSSNWQSICCLNTCG